MVNKRLKIRIMEQGYKNYELAKEIEMHPNRLSQIINQIYPSNESERKRIAKSLGTTEEELFPETVKTSHA
ncbi:MAG: helix-turn-helix transcriptional regulator [Nitrospina sp.]|jgi:plasmid maintenance system antidote protein VapI|nr:helix-turn-helix transcriptional regulator [Nitrospina sp.]